MPCCTRAFSSKDQEREGYSIPAQQRLLREYALQKSLVIAEEFVDVETAKQTGRTAFTAMLAYLKTHRASCRTILVEKTDRLYRNLKDWTTVDDLGTTIHLVKEVGSSVPIRGPRISWRTGSMF